MFFVVFKINYQLIFIDVSKDIYYRLFSRKFTYIYVIECKYKKCLLLLSTVQSKEKQTPNFVIALNKLSNIPLLQLPKKNLNNYLYF